MTQKQSKPKPAASKAAPRKTAVSKAKLVITDVMIARRLTGDNILSCRRYPDGSMAVIYGIGFKGKFTAEAVSAAEESFK